MNAASAAPSITTIAYSAAAGMVPDSSPSLKNSPTTTGAGPLSQVPRDSLAGVGRPPLPFDA
ncbi:MAG TPA: hypothetical protein VGB52_16015 [Actinomycetota bacterium]